MAQYYNGQYQAPPQQPQSGHPDPYNRQQSQYPPTDDQAYSPDQRYPQQYAYGVAPPLPARNNSTAVRQNNELFMDSGAPSPPTQSYAHAQHYGNYGAQTHYHQSVSTPTTYNPQDYAGTVSPAVSPPIPGVTRMPSFPTANPLPYNPADYADSNLQRASSSANRYSYMPASHTSAATGPLSSPSLYQNTAANRPLSMHSGRPQVQTNFVQRPSHYANLAPPPLPAIPGSADSPADDWGQVPSRYNRQHGQGYDYTGVARSPSQLSPGVYQPLSNRTSTDAYGGHASPSYLQQSSNSPSPGPTPPPHSTRYGSEQRPVSRPLPRLPSDSSGGYFGESGYGSYPGTNDAQLQEDLEHQIMNLTTNEHTHHTANGTYIEEEDEDDDPEALAGLAAMREAELQDEAEARRASGHFFSVPTAPPQFVHETRHPEAQGSDSDVAVDLSTAGGGFEGHLSYGGDPNQLTVGRSGSLSDVQSHSQTVSSSSSMRRPNDPPAQGIEPAQSPGLQHYRSDAYGTGGLSEPSTVPRARRLSYDEGDEGPLMDYSTLAPGEPTELFFHPGMSTTRPLPPPPSGDSSTSSPYPQSDQPHHIQFHPVPAYSANQIAPPLTAGPALPRHLSEKRFGTLPAAVTPARSKTDAEARGRQQRPYSQISEAGTSTAGSGAMALDLPSLTKKFNPQKLTARDFQRCTEPWAVSAVVSWLKAMIGDEQYLKRSQLQEALIALFTTKIPTMQIAVAEVLSDTLLDDMEAEHVLYYVEEWLQFGNVELTGVLYQLTGSGCYASRLHDYENYTKCYAPRCQRTERKIDLSAQPAMGDDDWASYYIKSGLLTEERVKELPKDTVRIQNVLHEIIQKEENYVREIAVLTSVYRDGLAGADPPVIGPKRLQGFVWEVFGKAEAVKKSNEEHLLPQMKYRQKEQGPFISGFSDILREWVRKARPAYLEYASQYPHALYKLRQELERNMLFRAFVERCQLDPRSKRLDWSHFLKLPITRIQQFKLLLQTAAQKSEESKENENLKLAIAEVDAMVTECNTRVGDGSRKVDLTDLQNKLKLRPGMQRVDLNLDHLGREVLYQGDLLRIGGTRFTWLETHAILFDHYLVLAKASYEKGPDGLVKSETYDVSRLPIPMDLLVLDTRDDDPVIRSNVLGGRAGVTKVAPSAEQLRQQRQLPNGPIAPELRHSSTSTSLTSLNRTTSAQSPAPQVQGADPKEDKTLYPFRLKHLGKQTYTLYASSWQNREDWCNKIEEAKTKHAAALFTQNAEPFKLRVMADSAFAYDGPITGQKSIVIQGTPLDRAIRDVEKMYANTGRPGPVCRAKINCATAFYQSPGKQMVAVGTDFGVYISDIDNPRGWQRVINNLKVTQIAVLEEFSILLLISDKALIAYHLDQVCPASGVPPQNDNARRAPQKLSGSKDVGFFATGRMKDRTLVFYKKRDGISSTFKVMTVLEPVYQKSTEKRSRFPPIRSGKTDFFRDFDEFYIPTECMGMNMFHSSLAICTQKGFEILTLDKKQPISIPDLEQSHVQMIANRLAGQKPLGMFRLSEQEFLLCYEECAVYVNKHGDISRSVIMEFVGKARAAALYGPYVLLFDPDFVEIRNAQNGRLRQVIAGRDVRCLDDAVVSGIGTAAGSGKSVKIALQHPANEKLMVLLELLLNEGTRE